MLPLRLRFSSLSLHLYRMWEPLHEDGQSEVVSEQPRLHPLLLSCDKGIITNNTIVQQTPDAEKQSHNYSRANSACLHAACRTVTETMNRDRRGDVLRLLH